MAGSAKRERQLAREHYERQQARRAERASKQRRNRVATGVAIAVLVLVAAVSVLSTQLGGGDDTVTAGSTSSPSASAPASATPTPTPTPSATAAAAGCTYTKSGTAAKDVGLPAYDVKKAASYKKPFTATIATDQGDVVVDMDAAKAPCTTNSFKYLAQAKYFDGTSCHRLTTENIYVLQCGDPTGQGSGGPGYQFGDENLPAEGQNNYPAGTVAMANAGAGTNGSQFFLVYKDTTLPPNYTIFGNITDGLDVVQKVAAKGVEGGGNDGAPAQKVTIKNVTVGEG